MNYLVEMVVRKAKPDKEQMMRQQMRLDQGRERITIAAVSKIIISCEHDAFRLACGSMEFKKPTVPNGGHTLRHHGAGSLSVCARHFEQAVIIECNRACGGKRGQETGCQAIAWKIHCLRYSPSERIA